MARIRTIKPSFFSSLSITELEISTRLTFIGLWTFVDDAGRGVDDARLVKAELWPLDDTYTVKRVERDLCTLAEKGRIERYKAGGRRYLRVMNWSEHQYINRPQPSKFPASSVNDHGTFTERSVSDPASVTDRSLREGKGIGREGKGYPPTPLRGGRNPHGISDPVVTVPTVEETEALLAEYNLERTPAPPRPANLVNLGHHPEDAA